MKTYLYVLILIILSFSVSATWQNVSFDRCKNITITNAGATTLTGYPAYINLTYDSDMLSNYADIMFYNISCNGTNGVALSYELENYTVSSGHFWVNVPSLPIGNTIISVYYKNNSVVGTLSNPTAVWDANYLGVWHFSNPAASAPEILDSTGHCNGTYVGTPTVSPITFIGGALNITTGSSINLTTSITSGCSVRDSAAATAESIFYPTNATGAVRELFHEQKGTGTVVSYRLSLRMGATNKFVLYGNGLDASTAAQLVNTSNNYLINNTWFYGGGVYNSNEGVPANYMVAYKQTTPSYFTGILGDGNAFEDTAPTQASRIGASSTSTNPYNGVLDELRVSNIARSSDWLNQTSMMTFAQSSYVSTANEESRPTVSISVSLNTPINNAWNGSKNLNFSVTTNSPDSAVKNCSLYDNETSWGSKSINLTACTSGSSCLLNKTFSNWGMYIWNAYCCSADNNCAFASANYTLNLTEVLSVSLNTPTNNDWNTVLNNNFTVTATNDGSIIANCSLYNNETSWGFKGVNLTACTSGSSCILNYTFASNSSYLWNAYCCSIDGVCNFATTNYTLNVGTIPIWDSNQMSFWMGEDYQFGQFNNDGGEFDASPISLNYYDVTQTQKCSLWDCNSWVQSVEDGNSVRCNSTWDVTAYNGSIPSTYNCTRWDNVIDWDAGKGMYCGGGYACVNYSSNTCQKWNCSQWINYDAGAYGDTYCSGQYNCTAWNGDNCILWNCTAWTDNVAGVSCTGSHDCTKYNSVSDICDTWNCSAWTTHNISNEYYCSGGWNCTNVVDSMCDSWKCNTWTLGSVASTDYYCDKWNCTSWDNTNKICLNWGCVTAFTQSALANYDTYCGGGFTCKSWQTSFITDTCTYSGVGNWAIDFKDNCTISSNVDLGGNNISVTAPTLDGKLTLNANITNFKLLNTWGIARSWIYCLTGCFK